VAYGPASDSEEIARTGLAGAANVCPINVGKACKMETVVRASPQRHAHVGGAMEVSQYLFKACMWASVGDAWAEPRMLDAVETSGRVQMATY
jgi:hypothetical protein